MDDLGLRKAGELKTGGGFPSAAHPSDRPARIMKPQPCLSNGFSKVVKQGFLWFGVRFASRKTTTKISSKNIKASIDRHPEVTFETVK